ncbi:MAG: hypothetical protein AB1656_09860 [Candidatus Omnitrophota bacterium]
MNKKAIMIGGVLFFALILLTFFTRSKDIFEQKTRMVISTSGTVHFPWSAESAAEYDIWRLAPILKTPYVYCEFAWFPPELRQKMDAMTAINLKRMERKISALVDVQRGASPFHAEIEYPYTPLGMGIGGGAFDNDASIMESFMVDGQITLPSQWRFTPLSLNSDPFLLYRHQPLKAKKEGGKTIYSLAGDKKIVFSLFGLIGESSLPESFPVYGCDSDGGMRLVGAVDKNGDFGEYKYDGSELRQTCVWRDWKSPSSIFFLENGAYLAYYREGDKYAFLSPGSSEPLFEFGIGDLLDLIPKDMNYMGNKTILPLTWNPSLPCLVYFNMEGFPVFEIQAAAVTSKDVKKIFKLIGYKHAHRPFAAAQNNEVVLFADYEWDSDVYNEGFHLKKEELYYSSRRLNRTPGAISGEYHAVSLPQGFKFFSKQTIDGKYLIFYSDNALWRMRWNGENLKKVFPWE